MGALSCVGPVPSLSSWCVWGAVAFVFSAVCMLLAFPSAESAFSGAACKASCQVLVFGALGLGLVLLLAYGGVV